MGPYYSADSRCLNSGCLTPNPRSAQLKTIKNKVPVSSQLEKELAVLVLGNEMSSGLSLTILAKIEG